MEETSHFHKSRIAFKVAFEVAAKFIVSSLQTFSLPTVASLHVEDLMMGNSLETEKLTRFRCVDCDVAIIGLNEIIKLAIYGFTALE